MAQKTRRLLSRPERQARILEGAARAFAARGYSATSMDEVAAASDITKLIVYRHFESKSALYRAVLDEMYRELASAFASARHRSQERSPAVTAVLTVARRRPDAFRLFLIHAPREPDFADYAAAIRSRAVNAFLAGQRKLENPSVARWITEVAVSYVFESVLRWLELGSPDTDDEFLARCTAGLRGMLDGMRRPLAPALNLGSAT